MTTTQDPIDDKPPTNPRTKESTRLANAFADAGAALLAHMGTGGALAAIPYTDPQQYVVAGTLAMIGEVLPAVEAPAQAPLSGLLTEIYALASNGMSHGLLADDCCSQIVAKIEAEQAVPSQLDQTTIDEAQLYRDLTGDAMALGYDGVPAALEALRKAATVAAQARDQALKDAAKVFDSEIGQESWIAKVLRALKSANGGDQAQAEGGEA